MGIAIGGTIFGKVALGTTEIRKIYCGATLIHDEAGGPPVELLAGLGTVNLTVAARETFDAWLGEPGGVAAQYVLCNDTTWSGVKSRIAINAGEWNDVADMRWGVPLTAGETTLADVAAGDVDDDWADIIGALLAARPGQSAIPISLGWEFNHEGWDWSIGEGDPTDYIAAFRHVVGLFRAASAKFKIAWVPNWSVTIGETIGVDPEPAYPGDDYVDLIGMNIYYQEQFDGQYAPSAWAYKREAPYGLDWLADFADTHGKPIIVPEWGVNVDNATAYIEGMAAWLTENNVLFHDYWDESIETAFHCKLSDNSKPDTGAAFQTAFGTPTLGPNLVRQSPSFAGGDWYDNGGSGTPGTSVDHLPVPIVWAAPAGNAYGRREAFRGDLSLAVGTSYRVRVKFAYGSSNAIMGTLYTNVGESSVSQSGIGAPSTEIQSCGAVSNARVITVDSVKWLEFDVAYAGASASEYAAYGAGAFSATEGEDVTLYDVQVQEIL